MLAALPPIGAEVFWLQIGSFYSGENTTRKRRSTDKQNKRVNQTEPHQHDRSESLVFTD